MVGCYAPASARWKRDGYQPVRRNIMAEGTARESCACTHVAIQKGGPRGGLRRYLTHRIVLVSNPQMSVCKHRRWRFLRYRVVGTAGPDRERVVRPGWQTQRPAVRHHASQTYYSGKWHPRAKANAAFPSLAFQASEDSVSSSAAAATWRVEGFATLVRRGKHRIDSLLVSLFFSSSFGKRLCFFSLLAQWPSGRRK